MTRLPIFPLPNVVLFPRGVLPLHIFEPRYLSMMQDALAGDGLIGMVLLRPEPQRSEDPPPVFPVGCVGRISRAQRLPDGRFLIILRGEKRFRVDGEEGGDRGYRTARAILLDDPDPGKLRPEASSRLARERDRIEESFLEIAAKTHPAAVPMLRARLRGTEPIDLVHTVAFAVDLPPLEKQSVLDRDDPVDRAEVLRTLLEFRRVELSGGGPRNLN